VTSSVCWGQQMFQLRGISIKMQITPKKGIIVVEKHEDRVLNEVMVITENEDDKNLFTCKVVQGNENYKEWEIVVVWRYSLYKLNFGWEEVFFMEEEDVLATIKQDV